MTTKEEHKPREGQPLEVEGEIRDLIRRGLATARPSVGSQAGMGNLSSLIQRVCGTSVQEIEKLISDLQELRDYLMKEGQRIEREVNEYAQMNQSAMKSTKAISDSLVQWMQTAQTGSRSRVS